MANKTITDLTALTSVDRAADYFEVADTSDSNNSKKTTVNNMLNITGAPVGTTDTQALTNKTVGITNTVTLTDNLFTLQDNSDNTKQAQFQLSGIATGTTRTYTLPNASSTLVDLSSPQTLTGKTLTSPTINTATIANPTLTVDTVSEFTAANGVTVDGLNIKDSKLNTNNSVVTANITDLAVTTAKINTDAVTDDKLDYPRWYQEIGRTTLGSAGDTISVTSLAVRKYLKVVIFNIDNGSAVVHNLRFNNDTGSNYAFRTSLNGAADASSVSQTAIGFFPSTTARVYSVIDIVNVAAQEKLVTCNAVSRGAAGAGNNSDRQLSVGKWANTTDAITRVDVVNTGAGDFASGSEVVVLGHD